MFKRLIGAIIKKLCFLLAKIIYRTEIIGVENIPQDEGAIICGNHVHAMDAPVLLATIKRNNIYFMAKEEIFENKFVGTFAKLYNVFPVARGQKDVEAMRKAIKVIKEKNVLGIYPEGTRNGLEKGIKPKNGAVNIAIRTNAKIVPFGIEGSFKPFRKVIYRFGEPIDFSGYKANAKDKEVVDVLTNELIAKIIELRDFNQNSKINGLPIDKRKEN